MKTKLISAASKLVDAEGSTVGVSVGLVWVASAYIGGIGAMVGKAVVWGRGMAVAVVAQAVRTTNRSTVTKIAICSTLKRNIVITNRPRQNASTLLKHQLPYLQ